MPKGDNAGRPKGSKNRTRSRVGSDTKAASIIANGKCPMDIMVQRMLWWDREAAALEKKVREKLPRGASILEAEQTDVVKSMHSAFDKSFSSAERAAPYIHPRMSPMDDPNGGMNIGDLSKLSDAELDQYNRIVRKMSQGFGG